VRRVQGVGLGSRSLAPRARRVPASEGSVDAAAGGVMAKSMAAVREQPASVEVLKKWFAEKGVTKAKLGGVDVDGVWRGKYVSLDKFYSAAKGGLGFCDVVFGWDLADELYDNSQVTGWHTGYP